MSIFGVGLYGTTQIETNYNPVWYTRKSSYQYKFYNEMERYFPDMGERVQVYVGKIKYWEHLDALLRMEEVIRGAGHVRPGSVSFWFKEFHEMYCVKEEKEESGFADDEDFFSFGDEEDSVVEDCTNGETDKREKK